MRSELDSDGYEEIGDGSQKLRYSRPTAMELIQPREGQHRTLWCEIPEVVSSRVLSKGKCHSVILLEGISCEENYYIKLAYDCICLWALELMKLYFWNLLPGLVGNY